MCPKRGRTTLKEIARSVVELRRNPSKELVGGIVAKLVVDGLETIDFHEREPELATRIQVMLNPCVQRLVVSQTRQAIDKLFLPTARSTSCLSPASASSICCWSLSCVMPMLTQPRSQPIPCTARPRMEAEPVVGGFQTKVFRRSRSRPRGYPTHGRS